MLLNGEGVPKNRTEGFSLLERLAQTEDPEIQYNVGDEYFRQEGRESKNSERMWKLAAAKGHPKASRCLGILFQDRSEFSEAFQYSRTACIRGDMNAYVFLGKLYISGKGVEKDIREGIRLIKISADKNNGHGLYALAELYEKGVRGVLDPNPKESVRLLKKAICSKDPNPDSFWRLGRLTAHGIGCEANYAEAFRLCKIGSEKNSILAIDALVGMYARGLGTVQDVRKARDLQLKVKALGLKNFRNTGLFEALQQTTEPVFD